MTARHWQARFVSIATNTFTAFHSFGLLSVTLWFLLALKWDSRPAQLVIQPFIYLERHIRPFRRDICWYVHY